MDMQRFLRSLALVVGLLCLTVEAYAQSPSTIPYQAVARNSSGNLLQNQAVSVRFSIRNGSAGGTVVYQETHSASTNNLGLFTLNIGQGTPVSGTFASINWGGGSKFAQVELDPAGGSAYVDMGTTQMLSVPYALYAASSGSAVTETDPQVNSTATNQVPKWNGTTLTDGVMYDDGTNIGIGTASPAQKLDIVGTVKTVGFQMPTGAANGYVLQSNANGTASWVAPTSLSVTETDPQVSSSTTNQVPKWNGTTLTDGLIFDNGTNVGIGTTSPSYLLHVLNSTHTALKLESSSNIGTWLSLQNSSTNGRTWNLISSGQNNGEGAGKLLFNDASTSTRMLIDGSGNVGIGTTSPTQKLDIAGTVKTVGFQMPTGAANGYVLQSNASGTASWVASTALSVTETDPQVSSSTTNQVPKWNGTTLTDGLIYDDGTNVGIGTTSPTDPLHVVGNVRVDGGKIPFLNTGNSVFIGEGAGTVDDLNNRYNTFVGFNAGNVNTSGSNNAAFGAGALEKNTIGTSNVALGRLALLNNISGSDNVVVGANAGFSATGTKNVFLGSYTGSKATGSYNVFLGAGAGEDETGSDLLYIHNSNTSSPLIWGDFVGRYLNFNGKVGIGTTSPAQKLDVVGTIKTVGFQMPTGAASGYVLQSDASGNGSWVAPASLSVTETDPQVSSSTTSRVPRWTGTTLSDGGIFDNGINIGIGTSSPANRLDVEGGVAIGNSYSGTSLAPSNGAIIQGNVGIGTTSPGQKLDVSGTTKTTDFQMTNGATNGFVLQSDASGNASWVDPVGLSTPETDPQVSSSTTSRVPRWTGTTLSDGTIFDNGTNVGIGTTSPAQKLDIAGTVKTVGFQMPTGAANSYVLQSDASGNASWATNKILQDTDADTKIQVEKNADEDKIRFDLGGAERWVMTGSRLEPTNSGNSVFIGTSAGENDDLSFNENVGIGNGALNTNTSGESNVAVGTQALKENTGGKQNVALGRQAMFENETGNNNTAVGFGAMQFGTSGSGNTAVGIAAGYTATGSNCVFIGSSAGYSETGNNKLYIDNTSTSSPLIWGDFASNYVNINGNLGIGTTTPVNKIDVEGGIAIGSTYSGSSAAPTNGAIIEGNVGIGTTTPVNKIDVEGGIAIGSTYSGTSTAPTNGAIIEGRVGIGTTSPASSYQAHFYSTTMNRMLRLESTSTDGTWLDLKNGSSGGHWSIYTAGSGNVADAGSLVFRDNIASSDKMLITGTGNVGIGTTSPTQALLVVNGSENRNIGGYGFLNDNGNTGTSSGTHNYSIYASDRIAGTEFNAHSDARIKNIRGRSNNAADLETLMQLKITDYTLIDTVTKGAKPYKKVIAQEVEQVYPQAVNRLSDVVPDIYQLAEIRAGRVALANTLKAGERVKLIFAGRSELVAVTAADATGFEVKLPDEGQVFVYGREVSDFRTVDYEAISMLNVSATQELMKIISRQSEAINALKAANASMSNDIQTIKAALGLTPAATEK